MVKDLEILPVAQRPQILKSTFLETLAQDIHIGPRGMTSSAILLKVRLPPLFRSISESKT